MKQTENHCAVLLIVGLLMSLSTVAWAASPFAPAPDAKAALAPIKIGWTGPLTGNSAVCGVDSRAAAQLVFDEVNAKGGILGHPLELVAEDDQYLTSRAITSYEKLVHVDHTPVILASTYGGVFAVAPRAERDNVIIFDPLDCNGDLAAAGNNVFCLATLTESIGENFVRHLEQTKRRQVFIIYEENDPWMPFTQIQVERELRAKGQITCTSAGVLSSQTDFKDVLLRAKSRGADALIVLGNDQMGRVLSQARELGMQMPFYTVGSMESPGFQKLAGAAAEGTIVSHWRAPRGAAYEKYLTEFKAKTGRAPYLELASIPSYDVARIVAESLTQSLNKDGQVDVAALKTALYRVKNFPGVSGSITIDPDGAVRSIHERLFVFKGGKLEALEEER